MVTYFYFMPYYVYIIQSMTDHSYYKGSTSDYYKRIEEHNNGLSLYSSRKIPWKLVYLEIHETKRESLIREKVLKKYSHEQIQNLMESPNNKGKNYVDEWLKSLPNDVGD